MNMFKSYRKWLLIVGFISIPFNLLPANIIFDMHGVLVRRVNRSSWWQIGPLSFLPSFFDLFNPLHIEDTLFGILNSIEPRKPETPRAFYHDQPLPQIMCDWLCGFKSNNEIRQMILQKINQQAKAIDSKRKVQLMRNITNYMFTPNKYAKSFTPLTKGVTLLKKCRRQKNNDGTHRHRIFILSNWDAESFEIVAQMKPFKKFLKTVDGIVISGAVGLIKPDPAIFEYLFQTCNIDPDKELTIFIDDEEINVEAARELGYKRLKCLHCKNMHLKPIKKKLKKWEIY